jgi:hypothetical protein
VRNAIIAAAAAVAAIGATPLIVAAPASAWVPCGQGGVAANAADCAGLCALTGQCAGGPQAPPPAAPAPVQAAPPPPAGPPPPVPPPPVPVQAAPPPPAAPPPGQSPGPVSTWPGGVAADCANVVYAAHYNLFCATAPGGPYPVGENNPYENGTPLDRPVLKGH